MHITRWAQDRPCARRPTSMARLQSLTSLLWHALSELDARSLTSEWGSGPVFWGRPGVIYCIDKHQRGHPESCAAPDLLFLRRFKHQPLAESADSRIRFRTQNAAESLCGPGGAHQHVRNIGQAQQAQSETRQIIYCCSRDTWQDIGDR